MKTLAAMIDSFETDWQVRELDLDDPQYGEVLVRVEYCGLCHSDEHKRHGLASRLPLVGGHEGSGVIEAVGPGVMHVKVGDHVAMSFLPTCRRCRWCLTGQSYLCDAGGLATGLFPDGRSRFHDGAIDVGSSAMLGAFSQWIVVSENSVVPVDPEIPLELVALVSCSVATGWGSVVRAGDVQPGEAVVIYGVGGVGSSAVLGARMAGAGLVAVVDPKSQRRDAAKALGADVAFGSTDELREFLIPETRGVMADKVIVTVDVATTKVNADAFDMTRKGGTMVVTASGDSATEVNVAVPGGILTFWSKQIIGSLYGNCNPHSDIPMLLALYKAGKLPLDQLLTAKYPLIDITRGYADKDAGLLTRGVLQMDH